MALYETLRRCMSHPTAEELYRMLQPQQGGVGRMSRATVYNTLDALCRAGLARRLPTTNGCCRYDADTSDHLHIRLRDTSEICDVPADLGERLVAHMPKAVIADIEARMGIKIDGMSIQLLGRRASQEA